MAEMGRGCVKTQVFNLRIESPSRFRQSKTNSAVAAIRKRAIKKTILRLVGSCAFSHSLGHQYALRPPRRDGSIAPLPVTGE
jgi:hypothetical protein